MKVKEYSQGLRVKKQSNQCFATTHRRQGVTLSELPYRTDKGSGYYCMVRWDGSSRDEEVAVHILQPVGLGLVA
jgi:hypothetical protein